MPRCHPPRPSSRPISPLAVIAVVLALLAGTAGMLGIGPAAAAPTAGGTPYTAGGTPSTATFGIGPANKTALDRRPNLRYLADPGGALTDHIAVQNYSVAPLTLNLYTIDAVNGPDGAIGYLPKGSPRADASAWLRIPGVGPTGQVTVPARTARILPILLNVPLKATPGDHTAGVIVSLTSKVKGNSGQLVNFEQRVALRMSVRVGGDLVARLDIDKLHASFGGAWNPLGRGKVTVRYTVHNGGNVTLGGKQRVQVTGALGSTGSASALVDVPTLLPGGSASVSMTVNKALAELLMSAKVSIAPLAVAGDADPPLQDGVATTRFWAIPWIPLGGILLLLLAIPALVRFRRRRRSAGRHSGPPAPEPIKEKVPQ